MCHIASKKQKIQSFNVTACKNLPFYSSGVNKANKCTIIEILFRIKNASLKTKNIYCRVKIMIEKTNELSKHWICVGNRIQQFAVHYCTILK